MVYFLRKKTTYYLESKYILYIDSLYCGVLYSSTRLFFLRREYVLHYRDYTCKLFWLKINVDGVYTDITNWTGWALLSETVTGVSDYPRLFLHCSFVWKLLIQQYKTRPISSSELVMWIYGNGIRSVFMAMFYIFIMINQKRYKE